RKPHRAERHPAPSAERARGCRFRGLALGHDREAGRHAGADLSVVRPCLRVDPRMNVERIVLVCGDRNWTARAPIEALLSALPLDGGTVVITGGAPGADTIAWEVARALGHRNVRMDAPWDAYGKRAGPIRNGWMLHLLLMFTVACRNATPEVHAFHERIASSK